MLFSRHERPIVCSRFNFYVTNGAFSHKVKETWGAFFEIDIRIYFLDWQGDILHIQPLYYYLLFLIVTFRILQRKQTTYTYITAIQKVFTYPFAKIVLHSPYPLVCQFLLSHAM